MRISSRVEVLFGGLLRWMVAVLMCAAALPQPARADDAIKILVYNYASVPLDVLKVAESEAERLLGVTGSQLEWVSCTSVSHAAVCGRVWTKESPGLRFITGFNKYAAKELGHADVPVLATIYYEKVVSRVHEENADAEMGKVLGALVAHELCHLLAKGSGHSLSGLMKPEWGSEQFRAARLGKLAFTSEQLVKIKNRFAERALANSDAAGTTQLGSTRAPGN